MKIVLSDYSRSILLANIKGLFLESKRLRRRAKKILDLDKKMSVIQNRKYLGTETRYTLLAYAFLRGRAYKCAESKCADDNKPSANRLLETISPRGYLLEPMRKITVENVKSWLEAA